MSNTPSVETIVEHWFEKYRVSKAPVLDSADIYVPIRQMLALAIEVLDPQEPRLGLDAERKAKIELISTTGDNLRARKDPKFPNDIVAEIEQIALKIALNREMPT